MKAKSFLGKHYDRPFVGSSNLRGEGVVIIGLGDENKEHQAFAMMTPEQAIIFAERLKFHALRAGIAKALIDMGAFDESEIH